MSGISLQSIIKGEEIRSEKGSLVMFDEEILIDEDYELRGRREALFNKGHELASKMESLKGLVQNPISRDQNINQFKMAFTQLQEEQKDWFERVERLVEDYK